MEDDLLKLIEARESAHAMIDKSKCWFLFVIDEESNIFYDLKYDSLVERYALERSLADIDSVINDPSDLEGESE